ncbi:sodium:proton antiporter [Sulfuriflexus sp.]|uniref:cation:proton antiporter n=1 Tax=Sulfuriflexus sp. TaxID=2015443 RepID=UPI0028D2576E|nr:sodium:proton antiporter [Sulfuriflexus sp.]
MFIVMLLLAAMTHPLAEKLRLPFSALLLVMGFLTSQLIEVLEFDTGLRWYHFEDLIFKIFLPLLIFESALNINSRALLRNLATVLVLAIPVMLLSAGIIATILYYGINHTGFPWIAALVCGALLSATDPVAVLDTFKRFKVSERLGVLMEGESLFNDAIAIVLFGLLMSIAMEPAQQPGWSEPIWSFLYVFFGGIAFGLVLGLLALLAYQWMGNAILCTSVSLAFAYLAFIGAEEWLHVSGVMAVLSCGLCLGWVAEKNPGEEGRHMLFTWRFLAFIANAFVFLLVGLTINLSMFSDMWLGMLIGILAVLVARAVGVYSTLPWLGKLPGIAPITGKQQLMVNWGGLRGVVAVALALSLPLEFEAWYTIQSITYGVVLFSLLIQAPALSPLLKYIKGA